MHQALADRAGLCSQFGFDLKQKLRPSLRLDRRGQAEHDRRMTPHQTILPTGRIRSQVFRNPRPTFRGCDWS
jgi:hypothetical protein